MFTSATNHSDDLNNDFDIYKHIFQHGGARDKYSLRTSSVSLISVSRCLRVEQAKEDESSGP